MNAPDRHAITMPVAGITKYRDRESGQTKSAYIDGIGVANIVLRDGIYMGPRDIRRIIVVLDAVPVAQPQGDGRVRVVLSIAPPPRQSSRDGEPAEAHPALVGPAWRDRKPTPVTGLNLLVAESHTFQPPLRERCCVLDTETTGHDFEGEDRIVEVAAVEMENGIPTGREFHTLVDPRRPIPEEATRLHRIGDADVANAPCFADIADDLLEFLGGDTVVMHNAAFDLGFLNTQLEAAGKKPIHPAQCYCTLRRARYLYPGKANNLDKLCWRFGIDRSDRAEGHGALIDARLLAQVLPNLQEE